VPDTGTATTINQQITGAIAAHSHWKSRLRNAIASGVSDFTVETVRQDNKCDFGTWLHGSITAKDRSGPHYATVKGLHAKFHLEAARILGMALGGQKSEASAAMEPGGEFMSLSSQLTAEMVRWRDETT
jgi:hypothetical protein